ncbi:MAG: hypothetical protein M2R45_03410 [Verrucomicrobia subdivision 3 bacterium]|nr:hypothetical protein [Limisphaerales bacterium]MCS1416315.1 hypothetical protein [Limisphaerales bacterium]
MNDVRTVAIIDENGFVFRHLKKLNVGVAAAFKLKHWEWINARRADNDIGQDIGEAEATVKGYQD